MASRSSPSHLSRCPTPNPCLPWRTSPSTKRSGSLWSGRRAVKPEFSLTEENASAVVEICARLDGLPLAIELAAARIKLLPPRVLLERLGNRLKLLTGGARNLPERQRTLRNAIEWSYGLLEEGEKMLFGRLGVFSGGATLEAMEAVCDARGDLPTDVFDGASSLLDKSLLRQEEGAGGEPRFVMLETIHEFANAKLEGERGGGSREACPRRVLPGPGGRSRARCCGERRMRRGWTDWNKSTTT